MARLLGAMVCLVASPLVLAPVAGADQLTSVQGQIAALQVEMSAGAGRVHALTAAFDQANLTVGDVAEQLAADQADLARTRAQLARSQETLRASALATYTGGGGQAVQDSAATALDPAVSSAYIDVAVGNLSDSLDQYALRQRQLDTAQAAVSAQERAARLAASAAGAARDAAIADAAAEQGRLQGLQAQLDALAARQAAADAASSRAVPAAAGQGGPVSNGLVAVVTTIVHPAPPEQRRAPAPAPPTSAPVPGGNAGGPWLQLRECESGDNYRADTGNGFYGAYQFSPVTWTALGYPGRPDTEPPAMQDAAAMALQARAGWGQWPACSAALGL